MIVETEPVLISGWDFAAVLSKKEDVPFFDYNGSGHTSRRRSRMLSLTRVHTLWNMLSFEMRKGTEGEN